MDTLQAQVRDLSSKLDTMSKHIEMLNERVSEVVSTLHAKRGRQYSLGRTDNEEYLLIGESTSPALAHKDILTDSDFLQSSARSGEKELSPETQIRRLTAQLTAAYNRIAALEEQLLARRVQQ